MAIALTEIQWAWLKRVAELTLVKQSLPHEVALRLIELGLIEQKVGGVFGLTAAGRTVVATVTPGRRAKREAISAATRTRKKQ